MNTPHKKSPDNAKQDNQKAKQDNAATEDRWQDSFSREPLWFIQCSIGIKNSGDPLERGRAPWWYADDGVDRLVEKILQAREIGAKRFFCNRPGGDNGPDVPNVGASWLTMDAKRRGELTDKLADLLADYPEIEIYWHVGSDLADPREFTSGLAYREEGFYPLGDTSSADRINGTRATMGGWISTGADGLSLDYTAQPFKRDHMIRLAESMRNGPFRFAIIGEAIPCVRKGDEWVPDYPALDKMPWVTTMGNFERRFPKTPTFDREQTRIIGWFAGAGSDYGEPAERVHLVQDTMELGLIVATCDEVMFQAAMAKARLLGEVQ